MNRRPLDRLRVAIVHEWFVNYAGSERVVEQMLRVLPQAELYALVDFLPPGRRGFIRNKPVTTSYLQKMPLARTRYRSYLALMPHAVEQLDVSGYDLVISSSHAVAKGVLTAPDQLHLCMCYSPIRYAWDLQHEYLRGSGLGRGARGWIAKWVLHYLRLWDVRTAHGVDRFIAISRFIAGRIRKTYGRDATVIYPPVSLDRFPLRHEKEDFYLAVSRMVPYKRMDLIVETFSRHLPRLEVVVIGDGPGLRKVRRIAGPNVTLLGHAPQEVLSDHMQRAKALVFAAKEDFGIVPVEAQSCGTPVIAYGRGGAAETVIDGETGILFDRQTPECLAAAIERFESRSESLDPDRIRSNAERFGEERFRREFAGFVDRAWAAFESGAAQGNESTGS